MRYDLVKQPSKKPTRKLKYGGLSGLITAVVIAVLNYYAPGVGDVIGAEIASLIVAAVTFGVGYLTRERQA